MNRQFTHALEHVGDLAQRTFGGLGHGYAVVGVADGHGVTADLCGHAVGDGQASSVVFGAVDARTRRESLHGRLHLFLHA